MVGIDSKLQRLQLLQQQEYSSLQQYRQQVHQEVALLLELVHLDSIFGEHNSKYEHHQAISHQHLEREMMICLNTNSGILRVNNEQYMLKQLSISQQQILQHYDLWDRLVVYYDHMVQVLDSIYDLVHR